MSRKDLIILIATILIVIAVAGAIFSIGHSIDSESSDMSAPESIDKYPGIVLASDDSEIESYEFPKEVLSAAGLVSVESDASTTFLVPLEISSASGESSKGIKINSSKLPCWLEIKATKDGEQRDLILRFSDDEENIIIQMIPYEAIDTEKSELGTKLGE